MLCEYKANSIGMREPIDDLMCCNYFTNSLISGLKKKKSATITYIDI